MAGPVVAIALILAAVFVPTVFIPGITGRLYQQFALTIAISVIISAFNALVAQPGAGGAASETKKDVARPAGPCFSHWFNRVFGRVDQWLRALEFDRLIRLQRPSAWCCWPA